MNKDIAKVSKDLNENASTEPHSSENSRLAYLRELYLKRGAAIRSRLDELLISPPFSDDARLRNIRDMITKWTEDLQKTSVDPQL